MPQRILLRVVLHLPGDSHIHPEYSADDSRRHEEDGDDGEDLHDGVEFFAGQVHFVVDVAGELLHC